ncbi:MAG: hypothetical protein ACLUEQ_06285 [Cloacibacillus evryensis]
MSRELWRLTCSALFQSGVQSTTAMSEHQPKRKITIARLSFFAVIG